MRQDEKTKARNDFNLMLQNATTISDESMIAEAHYWLGSAYEPYFGEIDEAMRHLTTAVEMARKTGNKLLEAGSLGAIGGTLMWDLENAICTLKLLRLTGGKVSATLWLQPASENALAEN